MQFSLDSAVDFPIIMKNTKNWYTIDALGATYTIFDTSDNFDTLNKV